MAVVLANGADFDTATVEASPTDGRKPKWARIHALALVQILCARAQHALAFVEGACVAVILASSAGSRGVAAAVKVARADRNEAKGAFLHTLALVQVPAVVAPRTLGVVLIARVAVVDTSLARSDKLAAAVEAAGANTLIAHGARIHALALVQVLCVVADGACAAIAVARVAVVLAWRACGGDFAAALEVPGTNTLVAHGARIHALALVQILGVGTKHTGSGVFVARVAVVPSRGASGRDLAAAVKAAGANTLVARGARIHALALVQILCARAQHACGTVLRARVAVVFTGGASGNSDAAAVEAAGANGLIPHGAHVHTHALEQVL